MTLLINGFESGSSGTAITTGNSGGSGTNAFDAVVTMYSGGAANYSNAEAAHGSLSGLLLSGGSGNAWVSWSTSLTATGLSEVWWRCYYYFPSLPGTTAYLHVAEYSGGSSGAGTHLRLSSTGIIQGFNISGSSVLTFTNAVTAGSWFRMEGYYIGSATAGQVQAELYLSMDSATPTETQTSGAAINTGGLITALDFGLVNWSGGSPQFYIDDVGASTTGYIGPVVAAAVKPAYIRQNLPQAVVTAATR